MQSITLLFKVLWSPGETMFLLSKNPRVLVPMIFLSIFSLVAGSAVLMKLDFAELTMRMIERSAQGSRMPDKLLPSLMGDVHSGVGLHAAAAGADQDAVFFHCLIR